MIFLLVACGSKGGGDKNPPELPPSPAPPQPPKKEEDKPAPPSETPAKLEPSLKSIQTIFVTKKCLSCHTEATERNRNVVLTDLSLLIEKTNNDGGHQHHLKDSIPLGQMRKNLIKPGCPKESFFLSIMKEGKMPPPPSKATPEELKIIEQWITSLKPDAGKSCSDEPGD